MQDSLNGKTAIVTGSSSGIGMGIAEAYAEAGANVVTNSRSQERAESTAEDIRAAGGTALAVEGDMSDRKDAQALVDAAVDEFGGVDVMVNNAGVSNISPALEMTEEEWREVIDVNLTGVFFGAQAAGQQMVEQDGTGQIINISSIFGSIGVQGRGPYNASKGGVNNLTRALAVELAEHDIQVNALAPGFIRTELDAQTRKSGDDDETLDEDDWPYYGYDDQHIHNRNPMGRFGTLEEMANCALFLAAGDHYMTGEIMHADGGWLAFGWGSKSR
ncbi:SDR family NAD(P)-dependent oxidoreductase [Natrinema gelatinilyticum]|uniref:SDR family NAD(P)-dependent oxidoreductase n=1 Tax=Natrinema gelatinilyticum TaxID=2961571 RepID=UPI0020C400A5|nr:SDR family oxidoreductase [Natrinema gelatinilyticum]